jgi:hypothetical protein
MPLLPKDGCCAKLNPAETITYRATLSERLRVEMFAGLVARGQPQVSDLVRVFVSPLAAHLKEQRLMNQCSRQQAGTTSQQQFSSPGHQRGHVLCIGLQSPVRKSAHPPAATSDRACHMQTR